jgi:LPXTG-motif cell wall-anchored protein
MTSSMFIVFAGLIFLIFGLVLFYLARKSNKS